MGEKECQLRVRILGGEASEERKERVRVMCHRNRQNLSLNPSYTEDLIVRGHVQREA